MCIVACMYVVSEMIAFIHCYCLFIYWDLITVIHTCTVHDTHDTLHYSLLTLYTTSFRSLAWLVMGSSLNRKHQISRRKEVCANVFCDIVVF